MLNANLNKHHSSGILTDNEPFIRDKFRKLDLSFENSEIAYKSKTNFELIRGLLVFNTFSVKYIVDNQIKVN